VNEIKNKFFKCHHCGKLKDSIKMLICCSKISDCKERYCYSCIKRFYLRGINRGPNLELKHLIYSKTSNIKLKWTWTCFLCQSKCKCKTCKEMRKSKVISAQNEKEPYVTKTEKVVKIGNFQIIEDDSISSIDCDNNPETENKKTNELENLENLISIVESQGVNAKIIKKQCLCCKLFEFPKGEIFKFTCLDSFLTYFIYFFKQNTSLTEKFKDNKNFEVNKQQLTCFKDFISLNKYNDYFKKSKYFCIGCVEQNLGLRNGYEILLKFINLKSVNELLRLFLESVLNLNEIPLKLHENTKQSRTQFILKNFNKNNNIIKNVNGNSSITAKSQSRINEPTSNSSNNKNKGFKFYDHNNINSSSNGNKIESSNFINNQHSNSSNQFQNQLRSQYFSNNINDSFPNENNNPINWNNYDNEFAQHLINIIMNSQKNKNNKVINSDNGN